MAREEINPSLYYISCQLTKSVECVCHAKHRRNIQISIFSPCRVALNGSINS